MMLMTSSSLNTTTTTNLHENGDNNKLYDDDDYDDNDNKLDNDDYYKEIHEALDLFETTMATFMSTNRGKTGSLGDKDDNDDEEETSNLISLLESITRVKAAIVTSASTHVVEGSELSDVLRLGWEAMNTWLYNAGVVTTGAGRFIREGLLKLVQVIDEEQEEEEENCCAICLEGMNKNGDVKGVIQHCDHSFHFVCLNKWMKRMHTCPVCRYEMDDEQPLFNGDCSYLSS